MLYNCSILYVPVSKPACPCCGIVPLFRIVNKRVEISGTCSHFLRREIWDGKPMLAYADEDAAEE